MGSYFISYETVIGMCTDINKQLYEDGLFTGQREIDLEIMAKNRLELICTPDEIATLTPEEYASYLENMKVAIISTNMAETCFKPRRRDIDAVNELKDDAVMAVQLTAFTIMILNPGTALAGASAMGSGIVGAADGGVRISQGDGFEGATEIALIWMQKRRADNCTKETTKYNN